MSDQDLILRYNYDKFIPENFMPWLNFESSPAIGEKAPDFPLWQLDGPQTRLSDILAQHLYTVVEFGSFT